MAEITKTLVNAILKEEYGEDGIANTAYEDNPWFAMMNKHRITNGGKHYDFAVKYGYASNASHTAATALNKTNTVSYEEFNVTTVGDYDAKSIGLQVLAEASDDNALIDALKDTVDSVNKALANRAGEHAFGHRGGARGQVASISTTDLVLSNIDDVTNFEVGQEIASSEADGLTGSLQSGTATITAIDRATGTLTTDSNWTSQIASLDADDYLFVSGDFGISRAGLADWCPITRTGLGTAFYGATRSLDETRLAGQIVDGTGLEISAAIRKGATYAGREKARQDCVLMSFETMNDLATERDVKFEHVRASADGMGATIGFDGFKILGASGSLECYADRSCASDRLYIVRKEAWKTIHSQSQPIKLMDEDGAILSREASSFGFDCRGSSFLNFVCRDPSSNCVVQL